jgi:pimeloyl-ACP methyl ester carboxylesterase
MPTATVNGVRLFYALAGEAGPPLALVHGSWGEHTAWDLVLPALTPRFRVLTYDRRGHSDSERPPTPGSAEEDTADLAALLAHLALAPAHLVGNSFGAMVALRLALRRPELVRSLALHEPPFLDLPLDDADDARAAREVKARIEAVAARLAAGDADGGARQFFDTVAFEPGTWDGIPPDLQALLIGNAPTFVDEARDPDAYAIDVAALAACRRPVLLTRGDQSLPFFAPIVAALGAALPRAEVRVLAGAGHVPQASHPEAYAAAVAAFADAVDAAEFLRRF